MAVKYHGILLVTPSVTPFTSDPTIWGFDVIVTATAVATITGENGALMATLAIGTPFKFGGTRPVSGEPIKLADYAATSAGNVHIAYAVRN